MDGRDSSQVLIVELCVYVVGVVASEACLVKQDWDQGTCVTSDTAISTPSNTALRW